MVEEIVSIRSTRGRYNIKVSCEDPKATKKTKTMKSGEWKNRRRMTHRDACGISRTGLSNVDVVHTQLMMKIKGSVISW
uniref:Uncharacterized protein n=1 Tax=Oryza punctata TaxID=4537 RepID=A0A0E0LCX9_ORYPU